MDTAKRAITELNGLEVLGRVLACVEFKPRKIEKQTGGGGADGSGDSSAPTSPVTE